ncbi:unnamed protein product [Cunninghamella blakesleeana]
MPNEGFDTSLAYGFTIQYQNWFKVINNIKTNQSYIVTFDGQPKPNQAEYADHIYINSSSINTIGIAYANNVIPYLELLDLNDKIISTDDQQTVTSNCVKNLGSVQQPSIMITNGTTTSNNVTSISFLIDDNMTPIIKAAWLVYLSSFFNVEKTAMASWQNNIVGTYNCNKENLAKSGAQTIAFVRYERNKWSIETSLYYQTLVSDAGMTLFNGTQENIHQANYLIDLSITSNGGIDDFSQWLAALTQVDPGASVFANSRQVFRTDGLVNSVGYSDWPERSPSRPDLMIQDIIHMVYSTYQKSYPSTWLRNFAKSSPSKNTNQDNNYPTCNLSESIFQYTCQAYPFDPKNPSSGYNGNGSSSNGNQSGLSIGSKIGIAIGVIVVVAGLGVGGFFYYQKKKSAPTHTFYKMNDI